MNKADFIRKELGKLPVVDFSHREQVRILCPFHPDSTPSCDVRLEKKVKVKEGKTITIGIGTFNCWSCKTHGPWNMLAEKLNLQVWDEEKKSEYEDQPDNPFIELARDMDRAAQANTEYVKPPTDGPWEGSWRGLTGSFLRSMGAESLWDKESEEYRIWFPICDAFGELVGHVAARGDNSQIPDKKKYLNSKGLRGTSYWFGLDSLKEPKIVVIVEGPYDMLRFRSFGIPAISNLGVQLRKEGTEAVSGDKAMQLLTMGCATVVLALDADRAGREASHDMFQSFTLHGFKVYDLNLSRYLQPGQETMDPGDCPEEVINDLKAFLGSL